MRHVITAVMEAAQLEEDMPETLDDPLTGEPGFRIWWHNTDGWRGFYKTEPLDKDRWELIEDGCVCGEWDDVPPGTRTSEVEARLNKIAETREIVVIPAPTSNVFSIGYDCYGLKSEGTAAA